ncbi:MAG: sulfatase-like hydrolase/transferase [Acidobacteriota bacterium]
MIARLSILLLLAALAGCSSERPSVLLISIDSLRADEPGRVVGGQPVSPTLDALAAQAVVYEDAVAPAPWTTPSMMSIMTGLDSAAHGVEEHDRALASSVETLAERFRRAGYRTVAIVPAVTLRGEYGFSRGFEEYEFESFGHDRISSPSLIGKLRYRLEQWRDEPFFAWIHLWDPHYNYIPQPPWDAAFVRGQEPSNRDVQCLKWVRNPVSPDEAEFLRGLYEGEIRFTDDWIARLFETIRGLGLEDRLIVAIVGDHGESFLEHGYLGHTNNVHAPNVRVPLMLRAPGRLAPGRVRRSVSTAGLGRTLLDLAGIGGADFGALPALPLPGSPDPAGGPWAAPLTRTIRRGCQVGLVDGSLEYILDARTCAERLVDLAADPAGRADVTSERPDDLARLRRVLAERWQAIEALRVPRASMPAEIVEQARDQLRTLGYVAAGGGGPDAGGDVAHVGCAQVRPKGRDAFGDVIVDEPCPDGAVRRCLGND